MDIGVPLNVKKFIDREFLKELEANSPAGSAKSL